MSFAVMCVPMTFFAAHALHNYNFTLVMRLASLVSIIGVSSRTTAFLLDQFWPVVIGTMISSSTIVFF